MGKRARRALGVIGIVGLVGGLLTTAPAAIAGSEQTYIVLYRASSVAGNAEATIRQAGGTFVYAYPEIGVVIARSSDSSFRANLLRDSRIEGAAATSAFAVQLPDQPAEADGPPPGDLPNSPSTDADPLWSLQWDMRQIHTPEAHAITGGSPQVVVGDIDTGLDYTHPDLAPNVDFSRSVSCLGGVPDTNPAAWQDQAGHGTHTAGTIAAAANGIGITGVAPNVKIAGIRAGNAAGYFFPEAVVCSFMWAATHGIDVTNNSYFADPWLFNCRNDPDQRAIWKAEQRAIRFAQQNGVTILESEGDQSEDRSHP
jgi:subtilisin family serine protease